MPDDQAQDGLPPQDLDHARQEDFSTQRQVLPECEQALLIVDFISPLNFDGAEHLAPGAVAMTGMDAYLRGYPTGVPVDCTAALSPPAKDEAMRYMAQVLQCDTRPRQAVRPQATD